MLAATGPSLLTALQQEMAGTSPAIGDAFITPAFALEAVGTKWVLHVISIIKSTPQGAWCPEPERLHDGVIAALQLAVDAGATTVALSAMGTGEGRVTPADAARIMIAAVHRFQQRKSTRVDVTFSLPTFSDYEAFRDELARSG